MEDAKKGKKKSAAILAAEAINAKFEEMRQEIEELRERIANLETPAVPAKDLSDQPTVVVNIARNTVEEIYSNVPGLVIIVRDDDVIKDPSVVEESDRNQTGVMELVGIPFSEMPANLREQIEEKINVIMPRGGA